MLDGSDSFDDSAIVSWTWSILDASKTTPAGNWNDAINITSCNYTGNIVRAEFKSQGPFKVRLTVKDDTEMEGLSDYVGVSKNPHFNPPTNLAAGYAYPTITVTVTDIEGQPVEGSVVNFLVGYDTYRNLTVNPWSNSTTASGIATTTVTGGNGTIRVISGKLAYVDIPI